MKDITEHQDDMFCACKDCREDKGPRMLIAERKPMNFEPVSFEELKNGRVPDINNRCYREVLYELTWYVDKEKNGYIFKYEIVREEA